MPRRPHQLRDPRYWPDPNVAPEDDTSAEGLLETAQHVGGMLAGAFGLPEDIARGGRMTAVAYRDLAAWIAGLEELTRCVLFLLALVFVPRLTGRPWRPAERSGQGLGVSLRAPPPPPNPDDAHGWRAPFRYMPPASCEAPTRRPGAASAARTAHRDPEALRDPWPLARRWEAVRRALDDPMGYAEKLAARLGRLSGPIDIREKEPTACRRPRRERLEGRRARNPCSSAMARAQRRAGAMLRDWLPPPEFWSSA